MRSLVKPGLSGAAASAIAIAAHHQLEMCRLTTMTAGVPAEILTSIEEFAALREQWGSLYERSPGATPFLAHDWLTSYWSAFGDSQSLRVLCVRDGSGRLTAATALRMRRAPRCGSSVRLKPLPKEARCTG